MQHSLSPPRPRHAERTSRFARRLACVIACSIAALLNSGAMAQTPTPRATPTPQTSAARGSKRVAPLRSADTPAGSRVTVTADAPLNDYAAYRSGDRFIVVVPGAAGSGGGGGVRGRGFSGADVQRRGNDLVYSFKLQPGAKARVNQRFNRLDVVFDAPGDAKPTSNPTGGAAASAANPARTSETPNPSRANQAEAATNAAAALAARERAEALAARRAAALAADSVAAQTSAPPTATPEPQTTAPVDPNASASAPAGDSPSPAPDATPADDQIAQAQSPPAAPAPPTSAVSSQSPAAQTPALGAIVSRYWGVGVGLLVLLLGAGLFYATRGKDGGAGRETANATASLDGDEGIGPVKVGKIAATTAEPVGAAVPAAAVLKDAPLKSSPQPDSQPTVTAASAFVNDRKIESTIVPAAAVAAAALVTPKADERETADDRGTIDERGTKPAPVLAAPTEADLDDAELVQGELQKLLAGDEHDERIIRNAGDHARTLARAELLAALATRDVHRRDLAREAFLNLGFHESAIDDLQHARASAERSSAARALGLAASTAATAALVSALEDKSPEVRRAAVEALAELRDPAAVPALEAVRTREKRRDMPRQLVNRAIAACASGTPARGSAATRTENAVAVAPVTDAAPAAPVVEESTVDDGAASAEMVSTQTAPAESASIESASAVIAPEPVVPADRTSEAAALDVADPPTVSVITEEETETLIVPTPIVSIPETAADDATQDATQTASGQDNDAGAGIALYNPDAAARAADSIVADADKLLVAEPASPPDESFAFSHDAAPIETAIMPEEASPFAETSDHSFAASDFAAPEVVEERDLRIAAPVTETAIDVASEDPDDWYKLEVTEDGTERAVTEMQVAEEPIVPAETVVAAEPIITEQPAAGIAVHDSAAEDRTATGFASDPATSPAEYDFGVVAPEPISETAFTEADAFGDFAGAAAEIAPTEAQASETIEHVAPEPVAVEPASAAGMPDAVIVGVPESLRPRLLNADASQRARGVSELGRVRTPDALAAIHAAFDDSSPEVRAAAALALHESDEDRTGSFTRALREATPERRRNIGAALSASGLATDAIGNLAGESREKTYEAFSLLFLMAKAGEFGSLLKAIEQNPNTEIRLAVVKLLALSGQPDVLPAFRRLAVRGSLPTEVRTAVMEAIYQIANQQTPTA